MKRKILWIFSILLAAAAIAILVIALRRSGGDTIEAAPAVQTPPAAAETAAPAPVSKPAEPEPPEPSPTEEPVDEVSADGRAEAPTPEPGQAPQGDGGNASSGQGGSGSSSTPPPALEGQEEDELPLMP